MRRRMTPERPGTALALEVRLQVAERAAHDRVGDERAHRAGDEAARIDAQIELGVRARAPQALEAPLSAEVAEVAAQVLRGEPVRLVVDLAQPVADGAHARVDDVLHHGGAPP